MHFALRCGHRADKQSAFAISVRAEVKAVVTIEDEPSNGALDELFKLMMADSRPPRIEKTEWERFEDATHLHLCEMKREREELGVGTPPGLRSNTRSRNEDLSIARNAALLWPRRTEAAEREHLQRGRE